MEPLLARDQVLPELELIGETVRYYELNNLG